MDAQRKYVLRWILSFICGFAVQTTMAAQANETTQSQAKKAIAATERAQREKKFEALLSHAVLEGMWQMTGEGGLTSKRPLTTPKPERYTIVSAEKIGKEDWLIRARIEIADDKDVTIPVPVRVLWAGDTPIITLDEIPIPILGTYSARVMMHGSFYSGIWWSNAKNYGGTMAGRIIKTTQDGVTSDKNQKSNTID